MDPSNETLSSAVRCRPLQREATLVAKQIEVSIPPASLAESWNPAQGIVNETGSGARTSIREARLWTAVTFVL